MFTYDANGDTGQMSKDMARVAAQLNAMAPEKAADWMAERQRWIANMGREIGADGVCEKLKYSAFELRICVDQLFMWEEQARAMMQVAA